MAAAPYANIRDQISSILAGDALTSGSAVYIEEEPQFGLGDNQSGIAVFTNRRRAPAGEQPLALGQRTRFELDMLFVVLYFSHTSFRAAADGRDGVLANLELVLMKNRSLNNTVDALWLEGGEFYSARDPQNNMAFVAVAEVDATCRLLATTV